VPALPPYLTRSPPSSSFVPSCPSERRTIRSVVTNPASQMRVVFEKLVGVGQSEGPGLLLAQRHIRNVS
jgi:hypothetical protein